LFIRFAAKNDVAPKVRTVFPCARVCAIISVIPEFCRARTITNIESTNGIVSTGALFTVSPITEKPFLFIMKYKVAVMKMLTQKPSEIIHIGRFMYEEITMNTSEPAR
jgi:hypothetical protein